MDSRGRTIFIADAHHDDGKYLIVRADEKLTAFMELESVIDGTYYTYDWFFASADASNFHHSLKSPAVLVRLIHDSRSEPEYGMSRRCLWP